MSAFPNITPKQDSNTGPTGIKQLAVIADASSNNSWVIELDAEAKRLSLRKVDSAGTLIATQPSVEIDLDDLSAMISSADPASDRVIKLRETQGCDADGNAVYFWTLRSKFYSTPFGSDFT